MTPIDKQIRSVIIATGLPVSTYRMELTSTIINGWEAIRPTENLDGAFLAIRAELAESNRQLAEARQANTNLAADNAALHEVLPEWIPTTGEVPYCDESKDQWIVYLTESGKTMCGNRAYGEGSSGFSITHYLSPSALAALPKREPEPEPEPEPDFDYAAWDKWLDDRKLTTTPDLFNAFKAGRESAK